jgi:hypothetical protein
MVFWIDRFGTTPFDYSKKRGLLAVIIFVLTSAWMPISREIFFGIMQYDLGGGIKIGVLVSVLAWFGAWGLIKRWF